MNFNIWLIKKRITFTDVDFLVNVVDFVNNSVGNIDYGVICIIWRNKVFYLNDDLFNFYGPIKIMVLNKKNYFKVFLIYNYIIFIQDWFCLEEDIITVLSFLISNAEIGRSIVIIFSDRIFLDRFCCFSSYTYCYKNYIKKRSNNIGVGKYVNIFYKGIVRGFWRRLT